MFSIVSPHLAYKRGFYAGARKASKKQYNHAFKLGLEIGHELGFKEGAQQAFASFGADLKKLFKVDAKTSKKNRIENRTRLGTE
jgi:hypothetical protein